MDINCIMILGTVLLNSDFLFSSEERILKDEMFFLCKELEVLEARRRKKHYWNHFRFPDHIFPCAKQTRTTRMDKVVHPYKPEGEIDFTINVKEEDYAHQVVENKKVQMWVLLSSVSGFHWKFRQRLALQMLMM